MVTFVTGMLGSFLEATEILEILIMNINYFINSSLNCKRFKKKRCRLCLEDQKKTGQGKTAFVMHLFLRLRPVYRRGWNRLVPGRADPSHEDSDCKGAEDSTGARDPCAGCRASRCGHQGRAAWGQRRPVAGWDQP